MSRDRVWAPSSLTNVYYVDATSASQGLALTPTDDLTTHNGLRICARIGSLWWHAACACWYVRALLTVNLLTLTYHGFQLTLHFILSTRYAQYSLSLKRLANLLPRPGPSNMSPTDRANATLLMLARNSDLPGVLKGMHQVEARFNRQYGYPWVLLNDQPFTDEFKR